MLDERRAEAVDREGAGDLERLAGGDVRVDLGIRDVGDERDGCRGHRVRFPCIFAGRQPIHAVTRMQDAGAAPHRVPPGGGDIRRQRLAENSSAEFEHGVAADDDSVELRILRGQSGGHIGRFSSCEQQDMLVRGERALLVRFDGSDDRFFVDLRRPGDRLDAGTAQQHETGGRRRGEADAHRPSVGDATTRDTEPQARRAPRHSCRQVCESQSMDSGALIDLDVTDVAHGGVFVGRHEGRVVFVPDAIPGERVRVRLTDTGKSSFWRGEVLEVLDASEHRQAHVWSGADVDVAPENRPGGADFGHIRLEHQRELKTRVVRDALERIGGLDVPVTMEAAHPARGEDGEIIAEESADGTGWRTRVSLHVDEDGNIGPFAARSHRVIPTTDLPLATAGVERTYLHRSGGKPGRVDLVQAADGRVRILTRGDAGTRGAGRGKKSRSAPRTPEDPSSREVLFERVGDREFRVDAGGFWQVHRLAATTLTDAVTEGLQASGANPVDPEAWHLDLYGGVGLLASAVGVLGGPKTRLTSVESDARATEHAGENLAEWVGARAETGRVDRWLDSLEDNATDAERDRLRGGVVILDPPRAGAGREVVESLIRLEPARIVYVACDPVALARDLKTFRTGGYNTSAVRAMDLFPHSHHVEAVAVLTR